MTHRDIRAMLRGAVKAEILEGWYWHGGGAVGPLRYVVHPGNTRCSTYGTKDTISYCKMLETAGVKPLYRN